LHSSPPFPYTTLFRSVDVTEHRWGEVNPAFGDAAVHYTREAGRLALAGEIDAMVSAPLNKEAMHAAGHRYEGQTEILGELTGTRDRKSTRLNSSHEWT